MDFLGGLVAAYQTLAALGIAGWWILRRGKASRAVSWSHLLAEALAAILLLTSALLWVLGEAVALLSMSALGMLLYASVNAIGLVRGGGRTLTLSLCVEAGVTGLLIFALAFGYIVIG